MDELLVALAENAALRAELAAAAATKRKLHHDLYQVVIALVNKYGVPSEGGGRQGVLTSMEIAATAEYEIYTSTETVQLDARPVRVLTVDVRKKEVERGEEQKGPGTADAGEGGGAAP